MEVSKLSVNLLLEEVYLNGMFNKMFDNIFLLKENSNEVPKEDISLVKKVIEDFKLNTSFMFTYGVGISGFVGPVSTLLLNKGLNVTKYDVTLLLVVDFYILLSGSKEEIDLMREELERKNLDNQIKGVLNFVSKSLGLLKIVGKKIGVVVTTLTDVLAFTFLSVPVMNMLKDYAADKGFNIDRVEELMYGLGLSAVSYTLKNLMKRK
jgi:hypothetical protein